MLVEPCGLCTSYSACVITLLGNADISWGGGLLGFRGGKRFVFLGGREVVVASSNLRCVIMTFSRLQTSSGYVGAYHLQKAPMWRSCAKTYNKTGYKFNIMGERPVTKCIRITWINWKEKNNGIVLNHSRCFPKTERGQQFDFPSTLRCRPLLKKALGWFSNTTGTSVDDGARRSKN